MQGLAYGNTYIDCAVKAEVLATPPVTNFGPSLDQAICKLKGAFSQATKITLAVPDPTRPSAHKRVLPSLLPLLHGKDITIIVACGAHGAPPHEYLDEIRAMIPKATVIVHDCDSSPLTFVGFTCRKTPVWVNTAIVEADLALGIGSVAIHPFAGFSGGPKVFIPGCAGLITITANHSLLVEKHAGPSLLSNNPLYQDLLEATDLLKSLYIINEALSPQGQALGYFAGSIRAAHLLATELALKAAATYIPKPYELVIASCGGQPRDINLYQAIKALDMASLACEAKGDLILLAECSQGVGSELYQDWAIKDFAAQEHMVQNAFLVGAHKAFLASRVLRRLGTAVLVSSLPRTLVERMGFTAAATLEEALVLTHAYKRERIAVIPFGTTTLPLVHTKEGTD